MALDGSVVEPLINKGSTVAQKVAPKNYGVLPPVSDEGLNQTTLCNFYGLSWRNLKRNSELADFDTIESYLGQKTEIEWRQSQTKGMTKLGVEPTYGQKSAGSA